MIAPSAAQLYCALDTSDLTQACRWAEQVAPYVDGVKLGPEFFLSQGPSGVRALQAMGLTIFLDLKFHDIPNTVAGAVRSVAGLGVGILTVHISGGAGMMRAAVEAARIAAQKTEIPAPKLIGVTVLTSLASEDLHQVGQNENLPIQVVRLAHLAMRNGLDGIVASAQETALLRARLGQAPLLVVPGIRPAWSRGADQKRVVLPSEAVRLGANLLVVGRPITEARDPGEAARRLQEDMRSVV